MKKRLILAITTILLVLNCFVIFAEETEEYQYEIRDGKAVLTSYLGTEPILEIPLEIEGYSVVGLEGTFKENRFVQEITIPDGIEFLGKETFYRCRNLEVVNLPDSITEMGNSCFSESIIREIYIPSQLERLPMELFSKCEKLENVDFSNSNIKEIGTGAFSQCTSLSDIEIPSTVIEIGEAAFAHCDNIEVFTIPSSVKTISHGMNPFVYGDNLKMIINLSDKEYDKSLFYCDEKFNIYERYYSWFTTEDGYEIAEYLPANATIYRRKKDSSKKYIEKYISALSNLEVSMEDINTREEMMEFVLSKQPDKDLESTICEVKITSFFSAEEGDKRHINGTEGRASIRINVTNEVMDYDTAQEDVLIKIIPIPYKEEEEPTEETTDNDSNKTPTEEYAERYKEVLKNLEHSGISMKIGNTPEELKRYIESLAPENKEENISYTVEIFEKDGPILFRKAVAGTKNNKNGTNGSCPVRITVKNTLHFDKIIEVREVIPILATQYEGSSNNNSSSKPDYDNDDDDSEDDESYTEIADNSYENKNSLSNIESLLVSNTATIFFGNSSQVQKIEKTENGICIISKRNEIIFIKSDGTLAKNEWQKSGSDWYYFDADYKAVSGWKMLGNKWYYLNETTKKMEIGWLKSPISGKWYYLDLKNGDMRIGWQQISNKWYYMDSTGAMMENATTPDGYRINENGEWVQ